MEEERIYYWQHI